MAARAWTRVETAKALFDATVAWLRSTRVLLPGASVLARLVAAHRDWATEQMHASLHQAVIAAILNVHGAYTFYLAQLAGLRPLRDPASGAADGHAPLAVHGQ